MSSLPAFQIRFVLPVASDWHTVEGADSADAVGSLLEAHLDRCLFVKPLNRPDGGTETVHFAVVEVQGEGQLVGRFFTSGIGRKGGVERKSSRERMSFAAVEQSLGLTPGSLESSEWAGAETTEEAMRRRFG